jgi:hypothetical protein
MLRAPLQSSSSPNDAAGQEAAMKQITGLCESPAPARKAVEALVEAGFPSRDISVLLVEEGRPVEVMIDQKTLVPQGIAFGSAVGVALGLAAALIGVFPPVPSSSLGLASLQGAVAGGALGALCGALAGLSWWRTEADIPSLGADVGSILVGVAAPESRIGEAFEVLREAGVGRIVVA